MASITIAIYYYRLQSW